MISSTFSKWTVYEKGQSLTTYSGCTMFFIYNYARTQRPKNNFFPNLWPVTPQTRNVPYNFEPFRMLLHVIFADQNFKKIFFKFDNCCRFRGVKQFVQFETIFYFYWNRPKNTSTCRKKQEFQVCRSGVFLITEDIQISCLAIWKHLEFIVLISVLKLN